MKDETFEIRGSQKVINILNFFIRQNVASHNSCLVETQKKQLLYYKRRAKNAILVFTDDIVCVKTKIICLSSKTIIGFQFRGSLPFLLGSLELLLKAYKKYRPVILVIKTSLLVRYVCRFVPCSAVVRPRTFQGP